MTHNKRILRARDGLVVVGTAIYPEDGVSFPRIKARLVDL